MANKFTMSTYTFKQAVFISSTLSLLLAFFIPELAIAGVFAGTNDYQLLAPLPEFATSYSPGLFVSYVQRFITLSITLAAIAAVARITLGGFQYMTGESFSMKESGKEAMREAVLGLVILGASFLILNTINPALLNFKLEVPALITNGPSTPQNTSATPQPLSGSDQAAMQAAGQSEVLTESLSGANGNIDPAKVQDFGTRCTGQGGTVRYNVAINNTAHCIK